MVPHQIWRTTPLVHYPQIAYPRSLPWGWRPVKGTSREQFWEGMWLLAHQKTVLVPTLLSSPWPLPAFLESASKSWSPERGSVGGLC